jgi:hypothetical protein
LGPISPAALAHDPQAEQTGPAVNELQLPVEWIFRDEGQTVLGKTRDGKTFRPSRNQNHVGIQHLERFVGLLRESKRELPFVQVIVVSGKEFGEITQKHGCITCPQFEETLKKQLWGRVLSRSVRVYMTDLNRPERVLALEMYLTHTAFYFSEVARQQPSTEPKKYQVWQASQAPAQTMFDLLLHNADLLKLGWPPAESRTSKRSL